jgi:hypothetical protein
MVHNKARNNYLDMFCYDINILNKEQRDVVSMLTEFEEYRT